MEQLPTVLDVGPHFGQEQEKSSTSCLLSLGFLRKAKADVAETAGQDTCRPDR